MEGGEHKSHCPPGYDTAAKRVGEEARVRSIRVMCMTVFCMKYETWVYTEGGNAGRSGLLGPVTAS